MTVLWLFLWAIADTPALHGAWLVGLVVCAFLDLIDVARTRDGVR